MQDLRLFPVAQSMELETTIRPEPVDITFRRWTPAEVGSTCGACHSRRPTCIMSINHHETNLCGRCLRIMTAGARDAIQHQFTK